MGNCVCQKAPRRDAELCAGAAEPAARAAQGERRCEEMGRTGAVKVTVRITKRQLQKLMAKAAGVDDEGMTTVEKVLAEIVSAGEVVDGLHRRRWEPALQSIPEAAVES